MAKFNKGKIEKEKLQSPYFNALGVLDQDLFILKELNKQIPKSIRKIVDKREKDIAERISKLDKKTKLEFKNIVDRLGKLTKRKKPSTLYIRDEEIGKIFLDSVHTLMFSTRFNMFIRDMSLVYLIAIFENFLQRVLEISFEKKPEILIPCQKTIQWKELIEFKDINEAKQKIIEKEISDIINQDIEDINKYFEQTFKTDLSQFPKWKKFKERFYRRNVIIHNSGMINKIYRLKTGYKGKDKRLTVSKRYLNESIELLGNTALKITEHFYNKFK